MEHITILEEDFIIGDLKIQWI